MHCFRWLNPFLSHSDMCVWSIHECVIKFRNVYGSFILRASMINRGVKSDIWRRLPTKKKEAPLLFTCLLSINYSKLLQSHYAFILIWLHNSQTVARCIFSKCLWFVDAEQSYDSFIPLWQYNTDMSKSIKTAQCLAFIFRSNWDFTDLEKYSVSCVYFTFWKICVIVPINVLFLVRVKACHLSLSPPDLQEEWHFITS